jgi:hypothetical protein
MGKGIHKMNKFDEDKERFSQISVTQKSISDTEIKFFK